MLKDNIQRVTGLINRYTELQGQRNQVKKYEDLLSKAKKLETPAFSLINSHRVLHKHAPEYFPKLAPDTTRELKAVLEDIFKDQWPTAQKMKNIEASLTEKDQQLRSDWERHLNYRSSATENTLNIIKPLLSDSSNVDQVIASFTALRKTWPLQEKHINQLDKALEKGKIIIEDLAVDDEIQVFLQKVIAREARLTDLKQEIMDWLKKNKMDNHMIISIEK